MHSENVPQQTHAEDQSQEEEVSIADRIKQGQDELEKLQFSLKFCEYECREHFQAAIQIQSESIALLQALGLIANVLPEDTTNLEFLARNAAYPHLGENPEYQSITDLVELLQQKAAEKEAEAKITRRRAGELNRISKSFDDY